MKDLYKVTYFSKGIECDNIYFTTYTNMYKKLGKIIDKDQEEQRKINSEYVSLKDELDKNIVWLNSNTKVEKITVCDSFEIIESLTSIFTQLKPEFCLAKKDYLNLIDIFQYKMFAPCKNCNKCKFSKVAQEQSDKQCQNQKSTNYKAIIEEPERNYCEDFVPKEEEEETEEGQENKSSMFLDEYLN